MLCGPNGDLFILSIIFIVGSLASLNNKSIPITNELPVLYVIWTPDLEFIIPSFKKLFGENSKKLGWKAGSLNCETAEYSLLAYLYLYAKQIKLSSKKESSSVVVNKFKVGAATGGAFITKISLLVNWSILLNGSW